MDGFASVTAFPFSERMGQQGLDASLAITSKSCVAVI
jgi:hypothetical protein